MTALLTLTLLTFSTFFLLALAYMGICKLLLRSR